MTTKSLPYSKFLLLVGDGASPEVFAQPCGLTSRGFDQTATTQDSTVPDCDDEDAPIAVEKTVDTTSAQATGAGVLTLDSLPIYQEWFDSGEARNCRLKIDDTLANNGGYWAFKGLLTSFKTSGQRAKKVDVDLTIEATGKVVWVPALA